MIPTGFIRLLAVNYRSENAGWSLDKVKGTVETASGDAEIPELTGTIQGPIEGPLKVRGSLKDVASLETLNGRLTLEVGQGRIRADRLKNVLKGVHAFVGTLLDPQAADTKSELLEFQSIAGDIQLQSGTASTDNLRLKGPEVSCGCDRKSPLEFFSARFTHPHSYSDGCWRRPRKNPCSSEIRQEARRSLEDYRARQRTQALRHRDTRFKGGQAGDL